MEKKKLDSQTIDRINNSPIVLKSKSNFKVKKWKKKYKKLDKKYTNAVKELDDLKADTYDEIESLKILSEAKDEEIVRLNKKVDVIKEQDLTSKGKPIKADLKDSPKKRMYDILDQHGLINNEIVSEAKDLTSNRKPTRFDGQELNEAYRSLFSENAKISKQLEKSGVKGTFLTVEQQLELIEKGLPAKNKHITHLVNQIGTIKSEYDIRINARDKIIARLKEQINQLQNKTK